MDLTGSPRVARGADGVRRTPEDVDAPFLTGVLRSCGLLPGDTRVVTSTRTPVGTGQMADTVRFTLGYGPERPAGAPTSVVGKFASQDPQSLATGLVMRAYEVEVRFYTEVAPRVASRVPGLLYAALDPVDAWFTLLLEDMEGAVQGDEIDGCDADVAGAAVGQMAGLHGPCWEDPDLGARHWIDRSSPEANAFTASVVTGVFPGFLQRYGDRLEDEHVRLLEEFVERIGGWMSRPRGPRTVVHADFRLDNLLFTPDRPDPVVVDFQTVNWGAGAYDLAYFVGGCLEPEVRRMCADDLLARYHGELERHGVRGYTLEDLRADFRRECFGGVLMAIGASMLVRQTERGDRMFLTSVSRHAQQALDLDARSDLGG